MLVWGRNAAREARMTKLAIVLLVFWAVFLLVDQAHRLLADDIYCRIGAGELRQTRGNQYCLHGSIWDAIMERHYTWYHDSNP